MSDTRGHSLRGRREDYIAAAAAAVWETN